MRVAHHLEVSEAALIREEGAVTVGDQVHLNHASCMPVHQLLRLPRLLPVLLPGVDVVVHVHWVDGKGAQRPGEWVGRLDIHHEDGRVLPLAPAKGLDAREGFGEDQQLGADETRLDAERADDQDDVAPCDLEGVDHWQPMLCYR